MRYIASIFLFILFCSSSIGALAKNLPAHNTAIVVIDVWNAIKFDDYVVNSLNPFLEKANEKGYLLINAPSQERPNDNLAAVFDHTVFNLEPIFPILNENLIKNIVYVGYDKALCVLDKPAGAFHLKNLGFDYNMYILESLSISSMRELEDLATFFLNELNVSTISTSELVGVDFDYNNVYWDLFDGQLHTNNLSGKNPLIILFNKNQGDNISLLSKYNIPIIEVTSSESDFDKYSLMQYIKKNNISDLIYAGHYADSTILFHELGALNLYIKQTYYDMSSIPKVFLLEDLFFVKNKMLDPKVTMSLLTNYYRPISLINLDSLSNLDMLTHGSVEKK